MTKPAPRGRHSIWHEAPLLGAGMVFPILDPSAFHGHVDSIERHLDAVRGAGSEMSGGEDCQVAPGRIVVLDGAGVEARARECYFVVRHEYDRVLGAGR